MENITYFGLSLRLAIAAGCAGFAAAASAQSASAVQTKDSAWMVLARSVEDRAIEYRQFGDGQTEVLVVGPLKGDETAAITLVEQLADHLDRFPRSATARVTIVRDPNPDGRLRRSPFNARGVQLNRNFATRNWHKLPSGGTWLSGREPESEAETRAIADLLGDLRPDRVIILASARRNAEVAYAGPAESLAREFAKSSGLRPVPLSSGAEPGSLATYAGADRSLPTLVVQLPVGLRGDQLWSTYKRALLATLGAGDSAGASQARRAADSSGSDLPRTNARLAATKQPSEASGAAAERQRVLKAEELEFGGQLAPIVRPAVPAAMTPRRQSGAAVLPGAAPAGPLFAKPRTATTANLSGSKPLAAIRIPPASLSRTNVNTVSPSPATVFRPVPSARPNVVERLPAVDAAATKQALPQPIPFYPETGY